jgi:hypothetical protein
MRHGTVPPQAPSLFEPACPGGFRYAGSFISEEDEARLLSAIAHVPFRQFELRGIVARRRVAVYGRTDALTPGAPMPAFLLPLRQTVADWINIAPDDLAMALISEYTPGTPVGWHRDAPQYDIVAGVSLSSDCRMKLRRYVPPRTRTPERRMTTHDLVLARRSAYLLSGEVRWGYEHHIPPVSSLRYSVTLRTLRHTLRPCVSA